ncbi:MULTISPECIES: cytochrome c1 [unclassified Devosia]|uniref:cytochrome c1 n=1 Tax=unclassified Devosia TaxID=196773 RepID=UPI00092A290E|nr:MULTISPECIES: cytochrome c1 [unclassified Devosia]MBL8599785.1 cytochrome c1 [Devosia sp.]OJX51975.1 MAG: cytochrome c1 [Devosia sp. 66-22]
MIKISTIFAAGLIALGLAAPVVAQEHQTPQIERQQWSFAGIFGKYDEHQLQRGFQVFREVCANCHGAKLLAFRNLAEEGGPMFSEEQVKALAAEYTINDPEAEGGTRKGLTSDRWPGTGQSDADQIAAFGIVPPDLSVIAKARSITSPFPQWIFNYFTTYSEGGPDYLHALLMGYEETPPEGAEIPDGKFYNHVFPGHAIGMPPPLADGQVPYANEDGSEVPAEMLTAEQYSKDVSAFLMWVAEPHLNSQKAAGFRVLTFLILFAVLMWFVKQRLWRRVH